MAAAVALSTGATGAPHIRSSDVSSGRSSTSLIDMYGARIDRSRSSSSMLRVINASSSSGQPDPFGLHSDGMLLPSGLLDSAGDSKCCGEWLISVISSR